MSSVVSTNGQSEGLKPWEPEQLSPMHRNILALLVSGMRAREIAAMEGMPSESRISVIRNSPAGKAFIEQMSQRLAGEIVDSALQYFQSHSLKAARKIVHLMDYAESERLQFDAARDVADRAGLKPIERVMSVNAHVSTEDTNRLLDAINESEQETPELKFVEDSSKVFHKENDIVVG